MDWEYDLSVIMPVYNGQELVGDAIESVLSQSFDSYELIIINDGSTDGSDAVIREYLPSEKIEYFVQENRGVSETTNRGIREANGEFLTVHPQDDYSVSSRFDKQMRILEDNPDVGFVYSPARFVDFDGNELSTWGGWQGEGRVAGRDLFYKLYVDGMFIASPSVVFRREHFRDEKHPWGDPDLEVVSDWEHWLDAAHQYDAYEMGEPLIEMLRDPDHEHLASRKETVLAEEKIVLQRVRERYADGSHPVRRRHYARAMSNHYMRELKYRLREEQNYGSAAKLALKAFAFNPLNRDLYYEFANTVISRAP